MTQGLILEDRRVLAVTGADRMKFLQDLVTNDLTGVGEGAVYAALLSPQGKYLFDFFVTEADDALRLDVAAARLTALVQRLTLYRLRADVGFAETPLGVAQIWGGARPGGADVWADPRDPALGWRVYDAAPERRLSGLAPAGAADWAALRVRHCVPETGVELLPEDAYILEAGVERLHGVDFKKGCYVGQEVTARMKHKTELRKGLARVAVTGQAPAGTAIAAAGRAVGTLFTQAEGTGLAHLRFDRVTDGMTAGAAEIHLLERPG